MNSKEQRIAIKKRLILFMLAFEMLIIFYFCVIRSIVLPKFNTLEATPSSTVMNSKKTKKAAVADVPHTTAQIRQKQANIKKKLNKYLATVTKDDTASVSFYNLNPKKGSEAAKKADASVYQKGALEANSNSKTVVTAASTYKLFISAFLFNQKAKGKFEWTTSNKDGFNRMIINSENDFGDRVILSNGMSKMNALYENQGWYAPVFSKNRVASTNSKSLMALLKDLEAGTGVFSNQADRKYLLGLMGKQVYRDGIPDGASDANKGSKVQDKVGFLDDANNDAGIVTLPNGQRYILVIMTHGHHQSNLSGFPRIAKITQKIQEIVYDS